MSTYTDYESVSQQYDTCRTPFGVDDILKTIQALTNKQLADIHVLDAGCGTGNYTSELLKAGVGKISLYDASTGMLSYAKTKVEPFVKDGRIESIKQGLLPKIPFEKDTFDVVMFNMVMHHLDAHTKDVSFPNQFFAYEETARVLKPGGVVVMTTCLPEQYAAIWYTNILPGLTKRMEARYPSENQLRDMFNRCNFRDVSINAIKGSGWARYYWKADGPLHREWRDLDSYWSTLSEKEVEAAVEKTKDMKSRGVLNQFMVDNDKSETVGHFTLVSAVQAKVGPALKTPKKPTKQLKATGTPKPKAKK